MPRQVELEYDENAGNAPSAACHLSFEVEQDFVVATTRALPWEPPADGNDDRTTVAIAWVESLLRMAAVEDPDSLRAVPFFTSCLSAEAIKEGINALLEAGLVDVEDDEDEESVRDFKDFTELQQRADELAKRIRDDDDRLRMDATRWDHFEALPGNSEYQWLEEVSIGQLAEKCHTLEVYSDLCKAIGPRALEATRGLGGEQVKVMAGGGQGGQLLALLKDYYLAPSAAALPVSPSFMAYRLPDFILDTRWPEPLGVELDTMRDYAFDVTLRATWQRASRNEWPSVAQRRLGRAIEGMDLLGELFADLVKHPGQLVREVQRLGDCLLPGEAAQNNVFCRLPEVERERRLAEEYEGLIREARANEQPAAATVDKIFGMAVTSATNEKSTGVVAGDVDDPVLAPKKAQLNRALAERSYVRLKEKYGAMLKDKSKEINKMDMLAECMAAPTILPKAVLLACPGTRVADYVGDADLLCSLVDERPKMRLYLGRCMAYDDEEDMVPSELSTFEMDERQYELLRSFQWHKLDPLNYAILRLKAEGAGTSFATHDLTQVYHHADMIDKVSKVFGKLFKGIGYPEKVDKEEGLTYEQFMAKVKRLQEYTLGMTTSEAKGTFALIDEYVQAGYKAAATQAKITIYGANPADKRLGAWIATGEPVLVKLNDSIKTVKEVQQFRRNLPNVFGNQPTARTLPGFEKRHEPDGGRGGGQPRGGGRSPGKKRQKTDVGAGASRQEQAGKDDERAAGMGRILASKELRIQENPKRVFYFDDGTYSMKNRLIDWPGVCKKFGWNERELCGPVVMTFSKDRNRDHNCMDDRHK